jgi:RNA polymerase sigma-70 factor (ECF subfamily)
MSGFGSSNRSNRAVAFTEEEILKQLMNQRDRVSAAAWLVVRDTHAAEDIFQNVALKAMTKEVRFENEGALLSWAFITARREGIDWLRRRKNEPAFLDEAILEQLEQEWVAERFGQDAGRSAALRDCIGELPAKSCDLLKRRYFDGYACEDVAQQLGIKLDAIYKRLSRLHHALKKCIETKLAQPAG